MSHPRFDNDPAYQEFLTWVDTNCQPGVVDPTSSQAARFLPASVLEAHFKDKNYYHLSKLLLAIFQEDEVPVDAYQIAEKCSKVFCTLLVIGKPQYIRQFAQSEELQDSRLPFSPIYHHPDFPRCTSDADPSEFLRRFCEMQWMVCAPKLDFQVHRKLQDDRILPFIVKKKLGGGGSAILHEIEIYPTYNLLSTFNGTPQVSCNTL
jgi:hypothetical protein